MLIDSIAATAHTYLRACHTVVILMASQLNRNQPCGDRLYTQVSANLVSFQLAHGLVAFVQSNGNGCAIAHVYRPGLGLVS